MFGQLVIGPPGSGKTTYCAGMTQFLSAFGRDVAVVNLDPANDILPYKPAIDISDLITITDVMDSLKLGPNGGLVYCMEYLEKNIEWLKSELEAVEGKYILFDCPGQVELYTHNNSVRNIVSELVKMDMRLVSVHLVDSHYCGHLYCEVGGVHLKYMPDNKEPSKFISVLLTSLSTMLQLELPHVNVLSKADLIEKQGKLSFNLDYYTEVLDLSFLLDQFKEDASLQKYKKLNEAIVGVVEDYSLVSFVPLMVEDKESMLRVSKIIDKANGYVFNDLEERDMNHLLSFAVGEDFEYDKIQTIREKYMDTDTKYDMESENV